MKLLNFLEQPYPPNPFSIIGEGENWSVQDASDFLEFDFDEYLVVLV